MADLDHVNASVSGSGPGSDPETEPESRPVEIEGFSDVDYCAYPYPHPLISTADADEKGAYQPTLGYLDEALSFIASERAWRVVRRDRGVECGEGGENRAQRQVELWRC